MIKKENGITLASLTMMVIIMFILIGTTVNLVYRGLNDYRDEKLEIELGIVRQAITEKYRKYIDLKIENANEYFVGEIIDVGDLKLPTESKDSDNLIKFVKMNPTYESECYYRITPSDMENLNIRDVEDTYIVNYSTGEVYNETKKVNSKKEPLYIRGVVNEGNITTPNIDKSSFNDWE